MEDEKGKSRCGYNDLRHSLILLGPNTIDLPDMIIEVLIAFRNM